MVEIIFRDNRKRCRPTPPPMGGIAQITSLKILGRRYVYRHAVCFCTRGRCHQLFSAVNARHSRLAVSRDVGVGSALVFRCKCRVYRVQQIAGAGSRACREPQNLQMDKEGQRFPGKSTEIAAEMVSWYIHVVSVTNRVMLCIAIELEVVPLTITYNLTSGSMGCDYAVTIAWYYCLLSKGRDVDDVQEILIRVRVLDIDDFT